MDTPGYVQECKTKPQITTDIEGTATMKSGKDSAKALLGGVLRNRFIVASDLLGELIRVTVHGAAPRPNAFIECLSLPLIAGIFSAWTFMTDLQIKEFCNKNK